MHKLHLVILYCVLVTFSLPALLPISVDMPAYCDTKESSYHQLWWEEREGGKEHEREGRREGGSVGEEGGGGRALVLLYRHSGRRQCAS